MDVGPRSGVGGALGSHGLAIAGRSVARPVADSLALQHFQHLAEHQGRITDDRHVGADVLVHLGRVEVDANDGALSGTSRGDHAAPQVGVSDFAADDDQDVGVVGCLVGGGQTGSGTQRRRMRLVQDPLAVDGRQNGYGELSECAYLHAGATCTTPGQDQRTLGCSDHGRDDLGDGRVWTSWACERLGRAQSPYPLTLEDVDGHLEVDRARAGCCELFEDGGDDLGDLVGALDPHAATAYGV